MEITHFDNYKFKIRGKNAVVNFDIGQVLIDDFKIFGPGEYEVRGVSVLGLRFGEHLIFRVSVEGVNVLSPGYLAEKLKDAVLEDIDGVDILFTNSSEIISQIEPKLVIPFGDEEQVKKIIKDLGKEGLEKLPKYLTSADKLPDLLEVVWL